MINIEEFAKVEMKVGKIISAEPVEGSEKLLKLQVDFGEKDETGQVTLRQILSGIAKWYTPEDLINKQTVFVTNLEPRMMMGLESQGMLLATGTDEKAVMIEPAEEVPNGNKLG